MARRETPQPEPVEQPDQVEETPGPVEPDEEPEPERNEEPDEVEPDEEPEGPEEPDEFPSAEERKGMRGHTDDGSVRPADGRWPLHRPRDESRACRAESATP